MRTRLSINILGHLAKRAWLVLFALSLCACQESRMPEQSTVPSWHTQQQIVQSHIAATAAEYTPLRVKVTIRNGVVTSIEHLFATPLKGTIRIRYDPQDIENSLVSEEDNNAMGFWYDQVTRDALNQAYSTTIVGPDVVYQNFKQDVLSTYTGLRGTAVVQLTLELFPNPTNHTPVWNATYMDLPEGKAIQAWIDGRVGQVISTPSSEP